MADGSDPASEIRAWMLNVLSTNPQLSAASWAKRAGVAGSTVQRAIKPDYQFVTSSRTLAKLAAAARVEPPALRKSRELQIVPQFLPVRYRVQAGLWLEIDGDEPVERVSYPVAPDPRYSEWPQWLELVVGDSANLKIPNGHYAHVVDAIEMGLQPTDGKWVVVERRRAQGAIRERTIKQIEVTADGAVRLWPRSTNPKWSDPVDLTGGVSGAQEIEVEIVGLVIGSYDPDF